MAYAKLDYQLAQSTVDNINNIIRNDEFVHDFDSWAHIIMSHINHIAGPDDTYMYIGALPTDRDRMKAAIYNRLVDDGVDILSSVGNSISILNGPVIYFVTIPDVDANGIGDDDITKFFLDFNVRFPDDIISDVLIECWLSADDVLDISELFLGMDWSEIANHL